ncbi:hypothetical protein Ocin01_19626 [Orchesella cincta]|uniref:Uncharacterized protein n=1 Tax=Orchesella cincta TaxID=48709 RepID=A0A1D2M271_ORCCI|nr:hypothetical protein Ocin01_19626 [Orchesella cincta]
MKPSKVTVLLIATFCALWLGMMVEETSSAPQIDWGCTISCTYWNACYIKNGFNKDQCPPYPSNCDCSRFAG